MNSRTLFVNNNENSSAVNLCDVRWIEAIDAPMFLIQFEFKNGGDLRRWTFKSESDRNKIFMHLIRTWREAQEES